MAMVINPVVPLIEYTAAAAQTAFVVPFEFFENADLKVYVDGVLQTLTTHYTVTGAGVTGGGTVTFVVGRTTGQAIKIERSIEIKRLTDFPTSGPFDVEQLNEDLDRIIATQQELALAPDAASGLLEDAAAYAANAATSAGAASTSAGTAATQAAAAAASAAAADATAASLDNPWRIVPNGIIEPAVNTAALDLALPVGWKHLRISGVVIASSVAGDNTLGIRFSNDNGATYKTGASDYVSAVIAQSAATVTGTANAALSYARVGLSTSNALIAQKVSVEFAQTPVGAAGVTWVAHAAGNDGGGTTVAVRGGYTNFANATHLRCLMPIANFIAGTRLVVEYC